MVVIHGVFYRLTVLHHAALAGNHSLMKLLLEHGVQVDVKDNKGNFMFTVSTKIMPAISIHRKV